ncbi:MAG: RluA family pseudouridine synthase [Rikenellaceae bacterium]
MIKKHNDTPSIPKEMDEDDYLMFEQMMSEVDEESTETPRAKRNRPTSKNREFVAEKNMPLMEFLSSVMPEKSKTTIKSYLRNRQITIQGVPSTQFDYPVKKGNKVVLNSGVVEETLKHSKLNIVFEDDHLLVVYKSNGLLSMASEKERKKTAYYILSEYLKSKERSSRIFIVHRLDRETSGLMLFAKSIEIQHKLQQNWNDIVLERKYIAVVAGSPEKNEGEITSYLGETKALKVYSSQDPRKGEKATTFYKVLKRGKYASMMELELETGKKNQIRVHMKELGCPIIGDKKYGGPQSPINRVALHARQIRFIHPVTEEEMNFESAIPRKFSSLL